MKKLSQWFEAAKLEIASIDYRALAFFRIFFGIVVFLNFLTKGFDLQAFYTKFGIYPMELYIEHMSKWQHSFHLTSDELWFQYILLIFSLVVSFAFIVGYKTKISTIILWLLVVSLHNRNYLILHSGDALIRIMLFWSIFLPLGKQFSMDFFLGKGKLINEKLSYVASLATFAALIQILYVYFFTALLKDHPEWHTTFEAVYYAMSLDQFTTPTGKFLLGFPLLLKMMTAMTFYLELLGPILLLIPFFQRHIRLFVPFGFIGLHIGLLVTMDLGLFPLVCIACWCLFLPKKIWDIVLPRKENIVLLLENGLAPLKKTLPAKKEYTLSENLDILKQIFILFSLICVTTWNVTSLNFIPYRAPNYMRPFISVLRLDQYWSMFSPYPMRADGWFVIEGKLKDGSIVDPWSNTKNIQWEKPDDFYFFYKSTQWRKYLTNVWLESDQDRLRLYFGKYVCRKWNFLNKPASPEKELSTFTLYFMREQTPPYGEPLIIKKEALWIHNCFSKTDKFSYLALE